MKFKTLLPIMFLFVVSLAYASPPNTISIAFINARNDSGSLYNGIYNITANFTSQTSTDSLLLVNATPNTNITSGLGATIIPGYNLPGNESYCAYLDFNDGQGQQATCLNITNVPYGVDNVSSGDNYIIVTGGDTKNIVFTYNESKLNTTIQNLSDIDTDTYGNLSISNSTNTSFFYMVDQDNSGIFRLQAGDNVSSIVCVQWNSDVNCTINTQDTTLGESDVEAMIFDSDNTGTLITTGNITANQFYGKVDGSNITGTELTDAQISDTLTCSVWGGESSQSDLNVNSSSYWDTLDTPQDFTTANFTNLDAGKLRSDDWTNVTVTESQISDLSHTTDTQGFNNTQDHYLNGSGNNIGVNLTALDSRYTNEVDNINGTLTTGNGSTTSTVTLDGGELTFLAGDNISSIDVVTYSTGVNITINALDTDTGGSDTHGFNTTTDYYLNGTGNNLGVNLTAFSLSYIDNGETAGGDLGGTYPNPTVDDSSHAHDGSNITGTELTDAQISDTLTCSVWDGESSQANLNVNMSNYWDTLDTPQDFTTANFTNLDATKLRSDDWTNVTVTESQISDLTHTTDTDTHVNVTNTSNQVNDVGVIRFLAGSNISSIDTVSYNSGVNVTINALDTTGGGSGGNSFDQSLNTTDDVTFAGVSLTHNLSNVLWVIPGNATDLESKISSCSLVGCVVYVPQGDYNITDITLNTSSLTYFKLQGDGYGSNIINENTSITSLYLGDYSSVSNLRFSGDPDKHIEASNFNEISNNWFINGTSQIYAKGKERIRVIGNDFLMVLDGDERGVLFSHDVNFSTIIGNTFRQGLRGVYLLDARYNTITGNSFYAYKMDRGVYVNRGSDYNTVSGNTFFDPEFYAVGVENNDADSGSTTGNIVIGNTIYSAASGGVVVDANFNVTEDTLVTDNVIIDSGRGVQIEGNSNRTVVQGNKIFNAGTAGVAVNSGNFTIVKWNSILGTSIPITDSADNTVIMNEDSDGNANITGIIYENNSRVCTSANGLCPSGSFTNGSDIVVAGIRVTHNVSNVLWVIPGNATDIQSKINACPSIGCTVIIPPGDYGLKTNINLTSNLVVEISSGAVLYYVSGANVTAFTDQQSAVYNGLFTGLNLENISIVNRGLIFPRKEASDANGTETITFINNSENIRIIGGNIKGAGDGYAIHNSRFIEVEDVFSDGILAAAVWTECSNISSISSVYGSGTEAVDLNAYDRNVVISDVIYYGDSSSEIIDINDAEGVILNNIYGLNADRVLRSGGSGPRFASCSEVTGTGNTITATNVYCSSCSNTSQLGAGNVSYLENVDGGFVLFSNTENGLSVQHSGSGSALLVNGSLNFNGASPILEWSNAPGRIKVTGGDENLYIVPDATSPDVHFGRGSSNADYTFENGLVAIGDDLTPDVMLDVSDDAEVIASFYSGNASLHGGICIGRTSGEDVCIQNDDDDLFMKYQQDSDSDDDHKWYFDLNSSSTSDQKRFIFRTDEVERVQIKDSGEVQVTGYVNISTSNNCLYMPDGGAFCGNATHYVIKDWEGDIRVQVNSTCSTLLGTTGSKLEAC